MNKSSCCLGFPEGSRLHHSGRFRMPMWITLALQSFLFFFSLSKRQVWSRSMSVARPFITAAMKAQLMDMRVRSIGQERQIREGWVTIFLLLDNHVMLCRLSRDVTDWCLSFISPALIWHSSCFIIISAENPCHIILSSAAPDLWSRIFCCF